MYPKEAINAIMTKRGMNQGDFVEPMGMKHQSAVSQALNRDMRISMLLRFLNVLDCDLIVREREDGTEWKLEANT